MRLPRGFSRKDSAHLLGGAASACAYGEIDWRLINGSWRGSLEVTAVGVAASALRLEMQVRPMRPSEPTVVYMINGDWLARVDINGGHQGRIFSHQQTRQSSDSDTRTETLPDWFLDVPHADSVGAAVYRQVLYDAGRLFKIDCSGVMWVDPPEGGELR